MKKRIWMCICCLCCVLAGCGSFQPLAESIKEKKSEVYEPFIGYFFLQEHLLPILTLQKEEEIEEAELLLQKNKQYCQKLLTATTSGDELRNCLMLWELTLPTDVDLPYFFYREYTPREKYLPLPTLQFWYRGDEALSGLLHLEDIIQKDYDRRVSFGKVMLSGEILSDEVCMAYACDDGEHYPPLMTKEHFLSVNGKKIAFIGVGTGDTITYTTARSYLKHQLTPFQIDESEQKSVSLSQIKDYFSSPQTVFYYSNAGFERPHLSPLLMEMELPISSK